MEKILNWGRDPILLVLRRPTHRRMAVFCNIAEVCDGLHGVLSLFQQQPPGVSGPLRVMSFSFLERLLGVVPFSGAHEDFVGTCAVSARARKVRVLRYVIAPHLGVLPVGLPNNTAGRLRTTGLDERRPLIRA
jgi:hypothetical protein